MIAAGDTVTIKPHEVYSPSWGFLPSSAAGLRATVESIAEPFTVVKLESGAAYHTQVQHLEVA